MCSIIIGVNMKNITCLFALVVAFAVLTPENSHAATSCSVLQNQISQAYDDYLSLSSAYEEAVAAKNAISCQIYICSRYGSCFYNSACAMRMGQATVNVYLAEEALQTQEAYIESLVQAYRARC